AKDAGVQSVEIGDHVEVGTGDWSTLFSVCHVTLTPGATQRYFLPLAVAWEDMEDPLLSLLPARLARVRRRAHRGVLYDAAADPIWTRLVIELVRKGDALSTAQGGRIVFSATDALGPLEDLADMEIGRIGKEQSNSSTLVGGKLVLKVYRRLEPGVHPE